MNLFSSSSVILTDISSDDTMRILAKLFLASKQGRDNHEAGKVCTRAAQRAAQRHEASEHQDFLEIGKRQAAERYAQQHEERDRKWAAIANELFDKSYMPGRGEVAGGAESKGSSAGNAEGAGGEESAGGDSAQQFQKICEDRWAWIQRADGPLARGDTVELTNTTAMLQALGFDESTAPPDRFASSLVSLVSGGCRTRWQPHPIADTDLLRVSSDHPTDARHRRST